MPLIGRQRVEAGLDQPPVLGHPARLEAVQLGAKLQLDEPPGQRDRVHPGLTQAR